MSNAMRLGKRSLAGLAAGALAAGTLAFVATPSANAAVATTIAFEYPSATLVATGLADDTNVLFPIEAFDAGGVPTTDITGFRVDFRITKPGTIVDDTILVSNGSVAGTNVNFTQGGAPLAGANITFDDSDVSSATWDSLVDATGPSYVGTYALTAQLVNLASGAVASSSTATFSLVTVAGAPSAVLTFVSGPALAYQSVNPLTQLGVTTGTTTGATGSYAADTFATIVSTTDGGLYLTKDDSVVVSAGSGSPAFPSIGGWRNMNTSPGLYATTGGNAVWGASGTTNLRASVVAGSATKGTTALPVAIAGVQAGNITANTIDAQLTNTLAYEASDDNWQLPVGTTKLDFLVLTENNLDDTTLVYDAWSYGGGTITPSGGRIAMAADTGSLSLTVSGSASQADDSMIVQVGPNDATKNDTVTITFANAVPGISTAAPIAKVGDAAPIPGAITDQFGRALPGTWTVTLRAVASASAAALDTQTAAADGSFTLTAPASASPASASTKSFFVYATNGVTTVSGVAAPVTYTATGGVTSLAIDTPAPISGVTATTRPLIRVPATGIAVLGTQTTQTASPTTVYDDTRVNNATQALELTAAVAPNAALTFTASEGALVTPRPAGSVFYGDATSSYTATSGATATIWAIATKPGLHTITVRAGSSTATYSFYAAVQSIAARTLTATPTEVTIARNAFTQIELQVKDIFGNNVPRYVGLAATAVGPGTVTQPAATNAEGKASVFYTAPAADGLARVNFSSTGSWITGAIVGAPDVVRTAVTNVTIGGAPTTKSILIVGERGTVGGKSGILVDGAVTGIENGKTVTPFIRFPGETTFTAGTARPVITDGEFFWQRKTGKRVTVYVELSDDASVRSNRVTIQAS